MHSLWWINLSNYTLYFIYYKYLYFIRCIFSCLILEPVEDYVGYSFKYYDQTQNVFGTKSFKYLFRNWSLNIKSRARVLISRFNLFFSNVTLLYLL